MLWYTTLWRVSSSWYSCPVAQIYYSWIAVSRILSCHLGYGHILYRALHLPTYLLYIPHLLCNVLPTLLRIRVSSYYLPPPPHTISWLLILLYQGRCRWSVYCPFHITGARPLCTWRDACRKGHQPWVFSSTPTIIQVNYTYILYFYFIPWGSPTEGIPSDLAERSACLSYVV